MKCNVGGTTTTEEDLFIHLKDHKLQQKAHFKYLSSVPDTSGDNNEDVKYKIIVGWLK